MNKSLYILLTVLALSCSEGNVQKDVRSAGTTADGPAKTQSSNQAPSNGAVAGKGSILNLSWGVSTGTVTAYHVYGLTDEKNTGGSEVASVPVDADDTSAPAAQIDLKNTNLPSAGKICFYVIAENGTLRSAGSVPACITL